MNWLGGGAFLLGRRLWVRLRRLILVKRRRLVRHGLTPVNVPRNVVGLILLPVFSVAVTSVPAVVAAHDSDG
jgi:hypothetical protein